MITLVPPPQGNTSPQGTTSPQGNNLSQPHSAHPKTPSPQYPFKLIKTGLQLSRSNIKTAFFGLNIKKNDNKCLLKNVVLLFAEIFPAYMPFTKRGDSPRKECKELFDTVASCCMR